MKGAILLSGGLDSSTLLAYGLSKMGITEVVPLTIFYGQRHEKEIQAAHEIAKHYDCFLNHQSLDLQGIFNRTGIMLLDKSVQMIHQTYQEIQEAEGPSPTYVPFRNAVFISAAVPVAMTLGAEILLIGVHAEDARGFAYPDCTAEFIGSMASAIWIGTYYKVRLVAPFQHWMKKDIIKVGLEMGVPYEKTWSCYAGDDQACGRCPTCCERLAAFDANQAEDPLDYQDREFWRLQE